MLLIPLRPASIELYRPAPDSVHEKAKKSRGGLKSLGFQAAPASSPDESAALLYGTLSSNFKPSFFLAGTSKSKLQHMPRSFNSCTVTAVS